MEPQLLKYLDAATLSVTDARFVPKVRRRRAFFDQGGQLSGKPGDALLEAHIFRFVDAPFVEHMGFYGRIAEGNLMLGQIHHQFIEAKH